MFIVKTFINNYKIIFSIYKKQASKQLLFIYITLTTPQYLYGTIGYIEIS